jgi:hypothetical protein
MFAASGGVVDFLFGSAGVLFLLWMSSLKE